jgi:hypothetical protein
VSARVTVDAVHSEPRRAVSLRKPGRGTPSGAGPIEPDSVEVGSFRPGSPASQWALTRYLAGRAIAESVGRTLLLVALVLLGAAALCWVGHLRVPAVLLLLVAVIVLIMRLAVITLLRRLTAFRSYHPLEERLVTLVRQTRGDVYRELRRVGLPSHTLTLPLLAVRLLRRRTRKPTLERLRAFRVDNVVPRARVDELHLLLRSR